MSERLTNEAIVDTALQALRDVGMPLGEVFLREAQSGSVEIKDGAIALAVEEAARATDARVTQFRKTTYSDSESTTMIATTGGVRGSFRESYCGAMTSAVATENGDRQIGYHGEAGRRFAELEPRRIGERAARRAAEKPGAKPLATQKLPV